MSIESNLSTQPSYGPFITRASLKQALEITQLINEAFWSSYKIFLNENHPASPFCVTIESIKEAINAEDKEFYVLIDRLSQRILGTALLQKELLGRPEEAKFNLLAKNIKACDATGIKVGDILIDHVIKRLRQLGKTLLKIEIVDDGKVPNRLMQYYRQKGFILTGNLLSFPRKRLLKSEYLDKVHLIELYLEIKPFTSTGQVQAKY